MTNESNKSVLSLVLLLEDLDASMEAGPVRLLALSLPRDGFRVTVGVLAMTPTSDLKFNAAVTVCSLPIRHMLDVSGIRRFRQTVREAEPAIVHAWGAAAVGAARLIASHQADGTGSPRLVVSNAAASGGGIGGWLVARQVRRADRVIPSTRIDGERYRRLGVPSERLTLISPAAPKIPTALDRNALYKNLGIPSNSILLVTGGQSDHGIGPKDAIVAFDMLRYDNPHLHMAVFGAGRQAKSFEQFGRALAFDDFRIRFSSGKQEREAAVVLSQAVLVTATQGGVEEALEAMAAGKPVVGWQTPDLAEIVEDGATGFLVPTGDRAAMAEKTRILLEQPELARRMGEAGSARAAAHFSAARMIEQYTRLYRELAVNIR